MERYLTTKAMPGKMTVLLEVAAGLITGLGTLLWIAVGIYGLLRDGLQWAHLMLLIFALPWMVVLFLLLRRWYNRGRARRLVSLLCASEHGAMTCSQLSRVGFYTPDKTLVKLIARQFLRDIVEVRGEIRLAGDEQGTSRCAYCGAALHGEGGEQCPACGARIIE